MYLLIKEGVYDHGIVLMTNDPALAREVAVARIMAEGDGYHAYRLEKHIADDPDAMRIIEYVGTAQRRGRRNEHWIRAGKVIGQHPTGAEIYVLGNQT